MTKKRIIIGGLFLLAFLPVVIAGFVFKWFKSYFEAGMDLGESVAEWVDEKIEK